MENEAEPQRLSGGNVAPVYRIGDTVRRATGPWTPAVHALLRHLERAGFDGAPRVLGFDREGREMLSYIEGSVPYAPDIPAEIWSDAALTAAARLLREYHDAVRSFEPPPDAAWRRCPGAPTSGEIVCHNDVAPWNGVYRDNVPLYYDGLPGSTDGADVEEYARRLRLFCDAYALDDRSTLLTVIEQRQQVMYDAVRIWGEAGVPGFAEMWQTGHATAPLLDNAFVRTSRRALASKL